MMLVTTLSIVCSSCSALTLTFYLVFLKIPYTTRMYVNAKTQRIPSAFLMLLGNKLSYLLKGQTKATISWHTPNRVNIK